MVPATVGGVAVLLLLVLPGLHYELLRESRRAGRDDSPFVEISRVLLSGSLLSTATFIILGIVRLWAPTAVLDPRILLEEKHYLADHLVLAGWSIGWFIVLALTFSALAAAKWPNEPSLTAVTESSWITTFLRTPNTTAARRELPPPYVKAEVTLKTGRVYRGMISDFSKNLEIADRELVLGNPLATVEADGILKALDTLPWQRLILPASEISSILVLYEARRDDTSDASSSQTLTRRADRLPASVRHVYKHAQHYLRRAYQNRVNPRFLAKLIVIEVIIFATSGLLSKLL
jgi:Family of unknown function (DUF6338)